MQAKLPPSALVIFGITGDLAQRKLLPALYNLASYSLLPDEFRIVGVSRRNITAQEVFAKIGNFIDNPDPAIIDWLTMRLSVVTIDLLNMADYKKLRVALDELETSVGVCMHRIIYLAIPAQTYAPVVERLGQAGLQASCKHGKAQSRLLIEKPFGYDTKSAQELIAVLTEAFNEDQTYRIDHYLAKETVQNILTFRQNNAIFRALWNRQHIRDITITASEKLGIEGRVAFYEQTGALRDLIQSHLLQLLALVTMEEPSSMEPKAIHAQKLALLNAVEPIAPNKVVRQTIRGQYKGYTSEVDNQHSLTETFAALRLHINNQRWQNVPIIIKTGKALAKKQIEIALTFVESDNPNYANVLRFSIQPDEGISLQLLAKEPGFAQKMAPVAMDFRYANEFAEHSQPDAYERVLADAIRGDRTLFTTSEEVMASWKIIEHILEEWAKNNSGMVIYDQGSEGPDLQQLTAG